MPNDIVPAGGEAVPMPSESEKTNKSNDFRNMPSNVMCEFNAPAGHPEKIMNRRMLLKTAAALTATPGALLHSTAAAMAKGAPAEMPVERVNRLGQELAEALGGFAEHGRVKAHVYPRESGAGAGVHIIYDMFGDPAGERIQKAFKRFEAAQKKLNSYAWENPGDDSLEWAEYETAEAEFLAVPCRTKEHILLKLKLLRSNSSLVGCLEERASDAFRPRIRPLDVILRSLAGETIAPRPNLYEIRLKRHQKTNRNERRCQAKYDREKAKLPPEPKYKKLDDLPADFQTPEEVEQKRLLRIEFQNRLETAFEMSNQIGDIDKSILARANATL